MQKLTKAEEEIMQIIWTLGPCTVSDIRTYIAEDLQQEKPPHSSISTIVRILEKKQFLNHKAYGRTYEYHPLITKEEYSDFSLNKLVSDYFEGSPNRLVSFLIKKKDLNLKDLNDLMNKLDNLNE
ncbi:MAG: BlaI/MecI/CopY family transcriptional regulator [Bacteroidota bacterium]